MSDYKTLKERQLRIGGLYEDDDFPADARSLYYKGEGSPYVQWKRPKEIAKDPKFIVHGAKYYDMQQGELGNCWFVAGAVSLASYNRKLFNRVVRTDQDFDKDYAGIFRFYFWQYGEWREVVIDDRLPTRSGHLIFCSNEKEPNEFWCPLLEKAYAKLYGSYEAIDGGRIHDAMVDMTGGISELIDLVEHVQPRDSLARALQDCSQMNTLIGGAIFKKINSFRRETRRPNGLYEGHAYSIVDMVTVELHGKEVLLLRLRNPWGRGEWNGDWSDGDLNWKLISPKNRSEIDYHKKADGEFWISIEDFLRNIDEIEMCHLYPDALTQEIAVDTKKKQWELKEFHGAWIRGVTAGGPLKSFTSRLFWKNPQYKLRLDKMDTKASVVVSLMEVSNKLIRDVADVAIGFVIFKLKEGRQPNRLSGENFYEYTPQLEETSGKFWPYRERTLRFELEPATYVIVPSTFKSSSEAKFYLRVMAEVAPNASPIEEPTGPIGDDHDLTADTMETSFKKHAGSDGRVDASSLRNILSDTRKDEYGASDGYSLETCRCLIALHDFEVEGMLDLAKARKSWDTVKLWTRAFKSFDVDNTKSIDSYELGELYKKVGFVVRSEVLKAVVRRYGGRDGLIREDDFIQSLCKIMTLYYIFKDNAKDQKVTMDLNQWLTSTLYT
ncbi:calpain-A-like [Haliotis rubra]|uniref:calpain-A-like n=1 Tax=Haliotis rubra TaxID=36100 RepID=UPI001EE60E33|nr:calpain-A-like [Haliotis rubra]